MISQLFLLSPRGDTIIFKDFRSNIPKVRRGCRSGAPQLLPGQRQRTRRLPSCHPRSSAPFPARFLPSSPCLAAQTSTEVFFRKATFWDGTGKDAPPAFHVDGVQYLHVKVGGWLGGWGMLAGGWMVGRATGWLLAAGCEIRSTSAPKKRLCCCSCRCSCCWSPQLPSPPTDPPARPACPACHALSSPPLPLQVGGLFWVASTRENVSPSLVLELLMRLYWICRDYFGYVSEEVGGGSAAFFSSLGVQGWFGCYSSGDSVAAAVSSALLLRLRLRLRFCCASPICTPAIASLSYVLVLTSLPRWCARTFFWCMSCWMR